MYLPRALAREEPHSVAVLSPNGRPRVLRFTHSLKLVCCALALTSCGVPNPQGEQVVARSVVVTAAAESRAPATKIVKTTNVRDVAKFREAYHRAQVRQFVLALWQWSHVPIDWFAVAGCETGGDWSMTGGVYSTGLGMLNAAIDENSPPDVALLEREGRASVWQIIGTAKRIEQRFGIHAWGCGRKLYP